MSFFPWSDEYSVHLQVIDDDHKGLVDTVNSLHEAIMVGAKRSRIGQIINTLVQYVDEHFSREEELMEAYKYPDIVQHKRIHRHLARTVYAIRVVFINEPKNIDPAKLLNFLREWLISHILDEDTRYASFMPTDESAGGTLQDGKTKDGPINDIEPEPKKAMALTVPSTKTAILRRCAGLLAKGGRECVAIEKIVMPSLDEHILLDSETKDDPKSNIEPGPDYDEKLVITVSVPPAKAAILRRCAGLLTEGGMKGTTIEHIVMPVSKMSFDEAMRYARPVLL